MVNPPITVMAKGAPSPDTNSPCPMANGNMATMVVMAVIRIGRTLEIPAMMRLAVYGYPVAAIAKCSRSG